MPRRFFFYCCALALLTACGGGGGGGSSSVIPSGPSPSQSATPRPTVYATLPPPSPQEGDVEFQAESGGSSTDIAYWPDYNVVAVSTDWTVVDAADGTVLATPPDGNHPLTLTYSPSTHSLVVATVSNIYAVGLDHSITTIATHLHDILALAAANDGTIYAIDSSFIVKISNGVVSNLTAPGSIQRNSLVHPSLAVSPDGTLWLSDPYNNTIDRVTASGSIVPFVGSCKAGPNGTTGRHGSCWAVPIPGTGSAANLSGPGGLAYDPINKTLYVANAWAQQLWAISASGAAAPVAGYGAALVDNGNGQRAFLDNPMALSFQPATNSLDIFEFLPPSGFGLAEYSAGGTPALPYTSPAQMVYPPNGLTYDDLAAMPDGGAWSADAPGANVVRISPTGGLTMYPTAGVSPTGQVALDRAGNAWYTAAHFDSERNPLDMGLLEVTPSDTQTYFKASPQHAGLSIQAMNWLAIGADGNPWFTENENASSRGSFGFVNPATHTVTQYPMSTMQYAIASVPSGVAFLTFPANTIQFASLDGQLGDAVNAGFALPDSLLYRASDKTFWFASGWDTISSIDASGTETAYTVCGDCSPTDLTIGPDGSIWADEVLVNAAIVRITPNGTVMPYLLPLGPNTSSAIAARPDGKLWVYNNAGVLLLFDPAVYDAMGGPHVAPAARERASAIARGTPWHTVH